MPAIFTPANTAHADLLHIVYRGQHLSADRYLQVIASLLLASAVYPTCCTQVGDTYRKIVLVTGEDGTDCTQCRMRIEI